MNKSMGAIAGHQRNANRDPTDFYPTDPRWTQVLLRNVTLPLEITEPCAGDGSMSRVLELNGHVVNSSDVRPRFAGCREMDAMDVARCKCIVTNPPYNSLSKLIPVWLDKSDMLCLLLRLNYLEGKTRLPTVKSLSEVIVIAGRMTVFGKVSQFPHAWSIWDRRTKRDGIKMTVDTPSVV